MAAELSLFLVTLVILLISIAVGVAVWILYNSAVCLYEREEELGPSSFARPPVHAFQGCAAPMDGIAGATHNIIPPTTNMGIGFAAASTQSLQMCGNGVPVPPNSLVKSPSCWSSSRTLPTQQRQVSPRNLAARHRCSPEMVEVDPYADLCGKRFAVRREVVMSPVPSPRQLFTSRVEEIGSSLPLNRGVATEQDMMRGFATQFAWKFSGDVSTHNENIAAVVQAYKFKPVDICYCFLCLEEASSSESGSAALSLGRWKTGLYAARVWVVSLARFVKAVQKQSVAIDEEPIARVCTEWKYKVDCFLSAVQSCEAPFQRNHGNKLVEAFKQENIRFKEVQRAMHFLQDYASAVDTRNSRLVSSQPSLPGKPPLAVVPERRRKEPPAVKDDPERSMMKFLEDINYDADDKENDQAPKKRCRGRQAKKRSSPVHPVQEVALVKRLKSKTSLG